MSKNYEEVLPENYKEIYHIDAKDKKTGLLLSLFSLLLTIVVLVIPVVIYLTTKDYQLDWKNMTFALYTLGCVLVILLYLVAHELVHGIAYKLMTKQKLTFGLSWSCAYCGVPNIYVYRKTAMIALMAPFTVFSMLFIGLIAWFYFINGTLYMLASFVFALHFGGCIGDLYMFFLFLFKFKKKTILMRDTGPEQFIYELENE